MGSRWRPAPPLTAALAVFALSATIFAAALPLLVDRHQASTGDGGDYVAMARDPGAFPEAPEGFRLLTPWLVSVLPGGVELGFFAVTVTGLSVAAALLFVLLGKLVGRSAARWGVLVFVVSGPAVGALRNPYLVDPLAFAFLVGALILLLGRRWLLLAAILAVGVLAKETLLLVLVPAAAVALGDSRSLPNRAAAVFVAPVAVYILLHATPLVYEHRGSHSYVSDIGGVFAYNREIGLVRAPLQAILYSLAALWVAALAGWRRADRFLRRAATFVLPVAASMVIAADWPRVLGYAFPVVIGLACSLPLSIVRRSLVTASVFVDAAVLPEVPSSLAKQVAAVGAFAAGAAAVLLRPEVR